MRRENKLALIIGFSVLLIVSVLVSDHLSQARRDVVDDGLDTLSELPEQGILFDTALSDESRVVSIDPVPTGAEREVRSAETTALESADRVVHAPAPAPAPAAVAESVPKADDLEEPIVFTNGPAASERLAQNRQEQSSRARGEQSGLLGLDTSKIRALLETKRLGSEDKPGDQSPVNGHIESAGKYVIQPGDTLYEICQRFYGDGERWHELAALNKGRVRPDGTVFVGVTLDLLPGAKSVGEKRSAERSRRATDGAGTRRYTVKKGDTLSEIAQREVGSVRFIDQIRELNPSLKKTKDRIMVGQSLVLPARRAE